jgi:hypothetical protein
MSGGAPARPRRSLPAARPGTFSWFFPAMATSAGPGRTVSAPRWSCSLPEGAPDGRRGASPAVPGVNHPS